MSRYSSPASRLALLVFVVVAGTIAIIALSRYGGTSNIDRYANQIERQPNAALKIRTAHRAVNEVGTDPVFERINELGHIGEAERYLIVASYVRGDMRFRDMTTQLAQEGFVLARGAISMSNSSEEE